MTSFYFGLNINRNLAEVASKTTSLKSINLDIKDLDKIRGLTTAGVQKTDLKSLSGMNFDAEKTMYALNWETTSYSSLTENVFDGESYLNTNINVSGSLAAAAYKYKYIDFTDNSIKNADVSTSRTSAWSTFETPVTNSTPIFYGGNVRVDGPVELNKFSVSANVVARKYESEIPTHRIKTIIDGQNIYLYAMKGIPLTFTGFFRNADLTATINVLNNLRPSWVVKETDLNSTPFEFVNRLSGTTSQINFRSSTSATRIVEFYYPPDRITSLNLAAVNLTEFPKVVLTNLGSLNLSSNDIKEFPDFSQFTSLNFLDISLNNLTRSANSNLRSFNSNIVARLPSSISSLSMGSTFDGNITGSLASLNNLAILNLSSTGRRFTGVTPTVNSSSIQTYNMNYNNFSSISSSVLNSTSIKNVYVYNNSISQTNIAFPNAADLENFLLAYNSGNLNLVNLSNKTKLISYDMSYTNITTSNNIKTLFNGCSALQSINFQSSTVAGRFPDLIGCSSLRYINLLYTSVSNFSADYVLDDTTFDACRNTLQTMYIESSNITTTPNPSPIQSNTFRRMYSLANLYISSRKAGMNGTLPSSLFADCRGLVYVWLHNNNLTGNVPTFSSSPSLFYLYAPNNAFSGAVPNIVKSNFRYLYLQNNQLTDFNPIESSSLYVLYLSNNLLTRIPNISNLTSLQELQLNNNVISTYATGALSTLTSLRILNLNNNNLTQGAVDQIILDLNKNYDALPRRGVSVNLRGPNNSAPSSNKEINEIILKLTSSGWTLAIN